MSQYNPEKFTKGDILSPTRLRDKLNNINTDTDMMVKITHHDLVALRDSSQLVPGRQYRIVDYVCTEHSDVRHYGYRSTNHKFDIILVADSVNKLCKKARATWNDDEDYFPRETESYIIPDNETMKCMYNGTITIDGTTYHKWIRLEDEIGDSDGDEWILTDEREYQNAPVDYFNGMPYYNEIIPVGCIYEDDPTKHDFKDHYLYKKSICYSEYDESLGADVLIFGDKYEFYDLGETIDRIKTRFSEWELYYDIDLDEKGRITYLKDEYGNSAYYDFKNILIERFRITHVGGSTTNTNVGEYGPYVTKESWSYTNNIYKIDENDSKYVYTFGGDTDGTLNGSCEGNEIPYQGDFFKTITLGRNAKHNKICTKQEYPDEEPLYLLNIGILDDCANNIIHNAHELVLFQETHGNNIHGNKYIFIESDNNTITNSSFVYFDNHTKEVTLDSGCQYITLYSNISWSSRKPIMFGNGCTNITNKYTDGGQTSIINLSNCRFEVGCHHIDLSEYATSHGSDPRTLTNVIFSQNLTGSVPDITLDASYTQLVGYNSSRKYTVKVLLDNEGHVYDKVRDSLSEGKQNDDDTDNVALGVRSHAEGVGTITNHEAEHAEGRYNKSTTPNNNDFVYLAGTYWAKHNIGVNPSDLQTKEKWYGNYYSWAETETKDTYTWNTYVFGTYDSISKYNTTDGKLIIEPSDDVATVTYGKGYRIPTKEECNRLINLPSKWVTNFNSISGLNGRVYANTQDELNGDFNDDTMLFIPAAGYFDDELTGEGINVRIWTKNRLESPSSTAARYAYVMNINEGSDLITTIERENGRPVRAVFDGNTQHSIGIGQDDNNRKNAVEVMGNGDVYITGIGGYNGTNPTDASTLQEVIPSAAKNGILTFKVGDASIATFGANQAENSTISIVGDGDASITGNDGTHTITIKSTVVPKKEHELIYYHEEGGLTTHQLMYGEAMTVDNYEEYKLLTSTDDIERDVLGSWKQFQFGNHMPEYGSGLYIPGNSSYGYGMWYSDASGGIHNDVNSYDFNGYLYPVSLNEYSIDSLIGTDKGSTTGDQIGFSIVNDSNAIPKGFETNEGGTYYRNTLYDIYQTPDPANPVPKRPQLSAWVDEDNVNHTAKVVYTTSPTNPTGTDSTESFPSSDVSVYFISNTKTSAGKRNKPETEYCVEHVKSTSNPSGYVAMLNVIVTNSSGMGGTNYSILGGSSKTGTIWVFGTIYNVSSHTYTNTIIIEGDSNLTGDASYWEHGYNLVPYNPNLDSNSSGKKGIQKNKVSFANGILTINFGNTTPFDASTDIDASGNYIGTADTNGSELKINFNEGTYDFKPCTDISRDTSTNIPLKQFQNNNITIKDEDGNEVTDPNEYWSALFGGKTKYMYHAMSYQNLYIKCLDFDFNTDYLIFYTDKSSDMYGVYGLNDARTEYERKYLDDNVTPDDPLNYFGGSRLSYNSVTGKLFYNDGTKIYCISSGGTGGGSDSGSGGSGGSGGYGGSSPVGTIQMYAGSKAPDGWMFCDGRVIGYKEGNIYKSGIGEEYQNLVDVIKDIYNENGDRVVSKIIGKFTVDGTDLYIISTIGAGADTITVGTASSNITDSTTYNKSWENLTIAIYNGTEYPLTWLTAVMLPDLQQRFPLGSEYSKQGGIIVAQNLGTEGGDASVTLTEAEMPAHTHYLASDLNQTNGTGYVNGESQVKIQNDPDQNPWVVMTSDRNSGSGNQTYVRNLRLHEGYGDIYQDGSTNDGEYYIKNTGGSQPHNNMPPYLTVSYIIRYSTSGGSDGGSGGSGSSETLSTLTVTGNATVNGPLDVNSLTVQNNATINGILDVKKDSKIAHTMTWFKPTVTDTKWNKMTVTSTIGYGTEHRIVYPNTHFSFIILSDAPGQETQFIGFPATVYNGGEMVRFVMHDDTSGAQTRLLMTKKGTGNLYIVSGDLVEHCENTVNEVYLSTTETFTLGGVEFRSIEYIYCPQPIWYGSIQHRRFMIRDTSETNGYAIFPGYSTYSPEASTITVE